MLRRFLLVMLFPAAMAAGAQTVVTDSLAQDTVTVPETKPGLPKRIVNKLTDNYYKSKYDSAYVLRPEEKWLVRLMANQSGDHIHAKGTINDVFSKYDLRTKFNTSVSLEVNFCDLALSLSLNPAKLSGDYNDYEFNFEYHGQKFSFDISYQRATSLTGDITLGDMNHLDEEGLRMNVVNIAAYYTFNHRRFSYPAALYQNYYQRRSAGSWLAGINFQGGSIKTTDALKERSPQAPEVHLTFANVGIGGGYGYNWVLGNRSQWLLHLSAMPTLVFYKHNKLTVNGQEKRDNRASFNMIFNQRAAVVYHFSPRYFAGLSSIISTSVFDNSNVVITQNKWMARAFVGVRF